MVVPEFLQGSSSRPLFDEEDVFEEEEDEESSSADDDEDEEGDDDEEEDEQEIEQTVQRGEHEIEGDFDRLVRNIREKNDGSLSRDWDISIEDQEATFRDDLRAASGVGKRKGKKGRRAIGPVLSQQVKTLLGEGNQAFVDGDAQAAINTMQEVIRIEPRAAGAWTVLAQCYEEMGQADKALQLRIMAAHLKFDAEEWNWLAKQSKDLGFHQQALYCYRKIYSLDPSNIDALWDRAVLAKEIGDLRTARHSFLAILKRIPHDLTIITELRPILIELADFQICAKLFQDAFEHYQAQFPTGSAPGETEDRVEGGGFGLLNILVLTDLYNTLDEYEKAVGVIKSGCRWLQGRAEQKYWGSLEDDREFDMEGMAPRQSNGETQESGGYPLDVNARHRLAIARIKMGDTEEGLRHANVVLSEDVLDYAPLFVEIADAFFEREQYAEAKPVYEILGTDPNTSSVYILTQTAACLRVLGDLKEAADIYEHVRSADPSNSEAKMKLAEIYEILGETRKALDLVYQVIDSRKRRPRDKQAGGGASMPSSSLFSEERSKTSNKPTKTRENRLTTAQLRELEAQKEKEVVKGYNRLKEIWDPMMEEHEKALSSQLSFTTKNADGTWLIPDIPEEGPLEKEWMIEAEKMIEIFRETRNLFLASRVNFFKGMFPRKLNGGKKQNQEESEDRMASRLQLDLENESNTRRGTKFDGVDDFRGVSFKEWLRIFLQYCFILTTRKQYELADEILRHVLISNAYLSPEYQVRIRLALSACAIHSNHPNVIVEQIRKLIYTNQFNNEMYRLLMASLSSGLKPTDSFIASTLQKFLFREMKLADAAVKNSDTIKWNPLNKRWAPIAPGKKGAEDGDDGEDEDEEANANGQGSGKDGKLPLPTKNNPLIVAMYGQMCIAAKSYQSAIFYLLHAFDYCPEDPMICLCLAIASIGRAMQRQSDNRHHLVTQGLAFLSKYRTLRKNDGLWLGEIEFNFGRTFQQLGLNTLAVKHYQRVLDMSETTRDENQSIAVTKEAAYNLALIYVTTGAAPLAQALYQKYLTV